MKLDLDYTRAQFPAFSEPSLEGWAFFENAGGSYACAPVIDRLTRFYRARKMQPYGPAAPTRDGGAEMDEARAGVARLLGLKTEEVSFGPSTTQNTYVLAQAFGQKLGAGDAIIVTNQDHEANTGPWRRLAERGIEVREWRMEPESGHLDPAALEALLDDKVRLVCFPHCSNVIGEINDVPGICARVRAAGALSCVDGVSYAPHGLPNVPALGADIYLFSTYKTYGPHQGVMAIRGGVAMDLPNQAHFFNGDVPYKRLVPAGPDHAQVAACAGMVDYFDALSAHHGGADAHDLMRAAEVRLLQPLLDDLRGRNGVRLLGPADAEARAPTVALALGRPAAPVAEALAARGIIAGGGTFYADRALEGVGVPLEEGVLRVSFVHYTSDAELDQLRAALEAVL